MTRRWGYLISSCSRSQKKIINIRNPVFPHLIFTVFLFFLLGNKRWACLQRLIVATTARTLCHWRLLIALSLFIRVAISTFSSWKSFPTLLLCGCACLYLWWSPFSPPPPLIIILAKEKNGDNFHPFPWEKSFLCLFRVQDCNANMSM